MKVGPRVTGNESITILRSSVRPRLDRAVPFANDYATICSGRREPEALSTDNPE